MNFRRLSFKDLPEKGLEIYKNLPENLNEISKLRTAYKLGRLFSDFDEKYKNILDNTTFLGLINGKYVGIDNNITIFAVQVGKIQAELNKETSPEIQQIIFKRLIKSIGEGTTIIPPFNCDFGVNIEIGEDTLINKNCNFLDDCKVSIGNRCLLGPGIIISAVNHDTDPSKRFSSKTSPVIIKDNVWIGAGTIINAGVTIGENSVVASGSVVIKDVPPNVLVAGNPAVIKKNL